MYEALDILKHPRSHLHAVGVPDRVLAGKALAPRGAATTSCPGKYQTRRGNSTCLHVGHLARSKRKKALLRVLKSLRHAHFQGNPPLVASLPKKSREMVEGSLSSRCSTRREQQPTVSASSSVSFSPPTRSANLSMKYVAVAFCLSTMLLP